MKRFAGIAFAVVASLVVSSARADDASSSAPHHTVGPWITIGVGAGVAAIGITSFIGAVKAHDDAQAEALAKGCTTSPTVTCPAGVDSTNLKTNVDGEHAMNWIGAIMTATGGAAIIGGVIWHLLEHPAPKKAAITIAPTIGGVVIAGQF